MRKLFVLGSTVVMGLGIGLPAVPHASVAEPVLTTFDESGTWTVPAGVTCATFAVIGAEGGSGGQFVDGLGDDSPSGTGRRRRSRRSCRRHRASRTR